MKHLKTRNQLNEESENLNISDVSDSYSIGDKYELFYNSNNPNYKMEHIDWFDYNIESGKLNKIE